ncbi:hypothetical protein OG21DRAFT_1485572 [Imleria badia]|nr:hypothetical protein OG21DRAFT_1485572 [Imleria badia]
MSQALDEQPRTQSTTDSSRGRIWHPSEKVLEFKSITYLSPTKEHEQNKQASEHREELTLKRNQASKAAQQDMTKPSAKKARGNTAGTNLTTAALLLAPDDAFASRPVHGTSTNTQVNLATQLIARKENVPPAVRTPAMPRMAATLKPSPLGVGLGNSKARLRHREKFAQLTYHQATGMIPARTHALTPGQLATVQKLKSAAPKKVLERQATVLIDEHNALQNGLKHATAKRGLKHQAAVVFDDDITSLEGDDTKPCDASSTTSTASIRQIPRKRVHREPGDDDGVCEGPLTVKPEDLLEDLPALSQGRSIYKHSRSDRDI